MNPTDKHGCVGETRMARSHACHTARHLHTRLRDAALPGSLDNLTRGSRMVRQTTRGAHHGRHYEITVP